MSHHRVSTLSAWSLLAALIAAPTSARALDEVSGIVKSVDVEKKKIAVTPTGRESAVDVTITDKTVMKTATGEPVPFKALKAGDGVGVAHDKGVALSIQVAVKPDELTGHVKSVAPDQKTFVVTQLGKATDATVAVTGETSIVTTDGKPIELKDLKKGDGVGIAHFNSLASKIVVSVKPADKQAE